MSKLPPFVILAVLVAAFAVAPGSASAADSDSVTATCTPDCGVWTQSAVQVQFSWTSAGTGETITPACTDTDPGQPFKTSTPRATRRSPAR